MVCTFYPFSVGFFFIEKKWMHNVMFHSYSSSKQNIVTYFVMKRLQELDAVYYLKYYKCHSYINLHILNLYPFYD